MFSDTHAHLTDEAFRGRIDEVVSSFRAAGVGLVINIGYDLKSSEESAYIAQKHPEIYFTAGLHPTDGEPATEANLSAVRRLAAMPKCVGIGEIGLDYHYGGDREEQKKNFLAQLSLAEELKLPVSVHARDCTADMLEIMKEWAKRLPAAVLHCYSMGAEAAKLFVRYGCHFAFGGAITFKNNRQIYEVAKVVPKDRLLTETDCPYMAPVPFRGEVNEPKYIPLVTEKLAGLYGTTVEEISEILLSNAKKVFNIRDIK